MQKTLIAFAVTVALLCSCRKLVTDEFPAIDTTPVLNAIMEAGQQIEIHLSYTDDINGDTIALAQGANIIVKEGNNSIDTLQETTSGRYMSSIIAQEETNYQCEAQLIDGERLSASCYLPKQYKIIAYEHIKDAGKDEEGTIYPAVKVTFENNPNKELYYQLLINLVGQDCNYYEDENGHWQEDCTPSFRNPDLINITDPLIVNEGLPIPVFSNELIEGDSYTMVLNYTTGSSSSSNGTSTTTYFPLTIELRSVSYEYYHYAKQLYLYEQGRYPDVIGDVARVYPLYSNINNGYGIFSAYASCMTDTITVE